VLKNRTTPPVKEKWVYCRDGDCICFEEFLHVGDIKLRFNEPILSISVDKYIALRTKSRVFLVNRDGRVLWEKKVKSTAVSQYSDFVAVAKGKKVYIYDVNGKKVISKKVKGKITALSIGKSLVVGSDRGLHVLNYDGDLLWELEIGRVTLVKQANLIALALEDELVLVSLDGELLWRKRLDDVIYDIEFNEVLEVYTYRRGVVTLSLDGNVLERRDVTYDFKFLPIPWVIVKREIEAFEGILKKAKPIKIKDVKKMLRDAKKHYKGFKYGEAYSSICKASETLKDRQLHVVVPKRVVADKPFEIVLKFYNFFDETLKDLTVDLSDFEKYFEISDKKIEFPEIRKGMCIERSVTAIPKYEGLFVVKIVINSNFGVFHKEFKIKVKKPILKLAFKRKKVEKPSIADLLK